MKIRKRKKFLYKILGLNIKKYRLENKIPLEELSTKTKITYKKFINLERGYYKITILEIFYIADVLKIKPYKLFVNM